MTFEHTYVISGLDFLESRLHVVLNLIFWREFGGIQRSLNFHQACSDIVSLTEVISENGNSESHSPGKQGNTCSFSKICENSYLGFIFMDFLYAEPSLKCRLLSEKIS